MKRTQIKNRPLKDTVLNGLEPEEKEYRELDGNGLYFRVKPNGNKSWQLRFKNTEGKWSWRGLGSYPSVNGATARERAYEMQKALSNGEMLYTQEELKVMALESDNALFSQLMNNWLHSKKANWDADTFRKEKQSIEKHLIPVFGEREYLKITSQEWFEFFQNMQRELQIYNRVEKLTSNCRNAYDLAKFQGKINFNPLDGINKFLDKGNSDNMKHVSIEELPLLINAIRTYSSRKISIGLELLALLFPRPQELRYATWDQFDFDKRIWIRPASIMKRGIAHAIPLSSQAIVLLRELETFKTQSNLLFPGRGSLNDPISDNTFNTALNRLGYKGRQHPHGFRHIASTALNNKFSDKEQVVESTLAHLKKGVKGVYDKGAHYEERIGMMQWWADEIDRLISIR